MFPLPRTFPQVDWPTDLEQVVGREKVGNKGDQVGGRAETGRRGHRESWLCTHTLAAHTRSYFNVKARVQPKEWRRQTAFASAVGLSNMFFITMRALVNIGISLSEPLTLKQEVFRYRSKYTSGFVASSHLTSEILAVPARLVPPFNLLAGRSSREKGTSC